MFYFGSDHRGFELKKQLIDLFKNGYGSLECQDLGAFDDQPSDYPLIAQKVAKKVVENPLSNGILICGSGIGMSIVANKFRGIRAALVMTAEEAKLAKTHNAANVLVLSVNNLFSQQTKAEWKIIGEIMAAWLTNYDQVEARHLQRQVQIKIIEQANFK